MGEVRYSVNGKYFKDFGISISDSEGLFDALKRKKVNTYDWAEYHGQSVDLSKPKFEAREITLKGFVVGNDWENMKSNFDVILREFQKSGTQRLLIEPFGKKPLPYEVYLEDSVKLEKRFKEGKMIGVFSIKLIEPNPIKKVLYLIGNTLNLSYNSSTETEIFYGNGLKETASGNVSLSGKALANRVVSGYKYAGRNLLPKSDLTSNDLDWIVNGGTKSVFSANGVLLQTSQTGNGVYKFFDWIKAGETYTISIWTKAYFQTGTQIQLGLHDAFKNVSIPTSSAQYIKTSVTVTAVSDGAALVIYNNTNTQNDFYIQKIKIEKGNAATEYSAAPEDEKYIIIAGNIEDITNLQTNAIVLWDKL